MTEIFGLGGESEIIRKLVTFTKYFEGIGFPLHADAKATVDSFFGKDGAFVLLCDKMFGKFVDGTYENEPEMCWMDLANVAPQSRLASALFRCISPGTSFVNFLEAVSSPPPTFASQLRKEWKSSQSSSSSARGTAESSTSYTVDFPLSSFLQNSYRLLAESSDADLFTFVRNKIPGALLLPFWHPPLMTRREPSTLQTMTSLPCSPLSYLVLRLLMYVVRRAEKDGAAVLSNRQYHGLRSCVRYCEDTVAWVFNRLPPTEFPFFSGIMTAYIQSYVTPSLPRNLMSKIALEDVQWTTTDAVASLLISAGFLFSHRNVAQPALEVNRAPVYEPAQLAPIVVIAPFLAEMHISIHKGVGVALEQASPAVPPNFDNSNVFKAADDVLYIAHTLYRNALSTLREAFLSLDGFPRCRFVHFNNILELWLTLMNPHWRVNGKAGFSYVTRHYEAYSIITVGFLNMAVKSAMVGALDHSGTETLLKCLCLLGDEQFSNMADAVHSSGSTSGENVVVNAIRRNRVLNWGDDSSSIAMVDIRHKDVCDTAAQLFVMIEERCITGEDPHVTSCYRECMSAISVAFPGASEFLDKWRQYGMTAGPRSPDVASARRSNRLDTSLFDTSHHCLTEEEKREFFKGTKRSCARISTRVRLPTNNGRVHGGHHPALRATLRQEFPALIGPTRYLDACIEKVMEWYYSAWIPQCERGHRMGLLNTDKFVCSNHSTCRAIWECAICERLFGSCCRNMPMTSEGSQLEFSQSADAAVLCARCGVLIPENGVCFTLGKGAERVFCPDCASRPFQPFSTRFLAAYSTWAWITVILLLCYYLMRYLPG